MRDQDAWLCFADESGQVLRPPKARTWSDAAKHPASPSGLPARDVSRSPVLYAAGQVTAPGSSFGCWFTAAARANGKGSGKGISPACWDAVHQQLGGPVVLVWDNYTHHVDAAMRELIEARSWLTVFRFPSYTPDLNPAEGVWAHLKNNLANLAPCSIDELAALASTRMKRMQYQPGLLDGFITETGLIQAPS
ncbi:transposase [Streptomyces sp. NPDC020883]|uniref:transposase n=1 Tax=Streptomyces sp. NPDC020883 TaxID=3365099 RepID=UPI00378BD8D5